MLDLIGEWLGEPRRGAWDDADYRWPCACASAPGARRHVAGHLRVARLLRPASAVSGRRRVRRAQVHDRGHPHAWGPDAVRFDIAQRALRTVEATTEVALTVFTDGLAFTFDDGPGWMPDSTCHPDFDGGARRANTGRVQIVARCCHRRPARGPTSRSSAPVRRRRPQHPPAPPPPGLRPTTWRSHGTGSRTEWTAQVAAGRHRPPG